MPDPPADASPPRPDTGRDAWMPPVDAGAPPPPDTCIDLPPETPPEFVDVSFVAEILTADVLFLVDVTGSMTDEIARIRETLRDVIVPAMVAEIPDVQLSVASLGDFPVSPYGSDIDRPFQLLIPSTPDIAAVQRAVDDLEPTNGGDGPESQTEALYQAATGEGRGRHIPAARCPAGTVGYPCFRATGSRIILLFTDAEFHEGPGGSQPYEPGRVRPQPAIYEDTVDALRGIGAKVLGLFSGPAGSDLALRDLQAIARDSGAVTPEGMPIVEDIGTSGERLDRGVIENVRTLADRVPIDIDVVLEDWPGDDVDATTFVTGVRTLGARPAASAIDRGDRFDDVLPGTRVSFRVMLDNEIIPRAEEPQSFFLSVVLRGDGVTRLKETVVQIVVPSIPGEGCDVVGR